MHTLLDSQKRGIDFCVRGSQQGGVGGSDGWERGGGGTEGKWSNRGRGRQGTDGQADELNRVTFRR